MDYFPLDYLPPVVAAHLKQNAADQMVNAAKKAMIMVTKKLLQKEMLPPNKNWKIS